MFKKHHTLSQAPKKKRSLYENLLQQGFSNVLHNNYPNRFICYTPTANSTIITLIRTF